MTWDKRDLFFCFERQRNKKMSGKKSQQSRYLSYVKTLKKKEKMRRRRKKKVWNH